MNWFYDKYEFLTDAEETRTIEDSKVQKSARSPELRDPGLDPGTTKQRALSVSLRKYSAISMTLVQFAHYRRTTDNFSGLGIANEGNVSTRYSLPPPPPLRRCCVFTVITRSPPAASPAGNTSAWKRPLVIAARPNEIFIEKFAAINLGS